MLELLKAPDFWAPVAAMLLFAVCIFYLKRCLRAAACKKGDRNGNDSNHTEH